MNDKIEMIEIDAQHTVDELIIYNKNLIDSLSSSDLGHNKTNILLIRLAKDTIAYLEAMKKIGIVDREQS